MKHTYLAASVLFVVFIGVVLFTQYDKDGAERIADSNGSFAYTCVGGSSFTMMPASDMSYIELRNAPSAPLNVRLTRAESKEGEGARYEGEGLVFIGTGEGVLIAHGDTDFNCDPVPSQTDAPFNWGDPAEGAGPSQDAAAAARIAIVGVWQSNEDPLFERSFSSDGTVTDSYDGKKDDGEQWTIFTGSSAPSTKYPFSSGTAYVQIKSGTQSDDDLYFSIEKVTPEVLEMTYMGRGNKLTFKRVQ